MVPALKRWRQVILQHVVPPLYKLWQVRVREEPSMQPICETVHMTTTQPVHALDCYCASQVSHKILNGCLTAHTTRKLHSLTTTPQVSMCTHTCHTEEAWCYTETDTNASATFDVGHNCMPPLVLKERCVTRSCTD